MQAVELVLRLALRGRLGEVTPFVDFFERKISQLHHAGKEWFH